MVLLAGVTALAVTMTLAGVCLFRHGLGPPSNSLPCSTSQPNDIEVHLDVDPNALGDGPVVGAVGILVALEDKENNDVCTSGTVTAVIYDYGWGYTEGIKNDKPMFSESWTVDARDFTRWKLMRENTEEKNEQRLMWSSGRIPYSKFVQNGFMITNRELGQVEVVFRLANGVVLKGESRSFYLYPEADE